ncbi:hypothetical protein AALB47_20980 [Lachnospiraceae bacterium 54-11]
MMKNLSGNVYLNQFKNGHLKLLTRLYLRFRGKRDARKKIIRENEHGIYTSPFIYQEIFHYNLAFHIEEERLAYTDMPLQAKIDILQLQIEQKSSPPKHNTENFSANDSNFEEAINILEVKKQELLSRKEKEIEIAQLRGKQLYSMLQARISAYWNGVLLASNIDDKLPPIVTIDQLAQGGELSYEEK